MKGAHSQFQGCTVASMPREWHIHFKWYHLALPCKWACHKVIPWLHHFLPVIVVQGPRSKVQAPVSSLAFSLAMAVWRDSLPKTRLRCKTRVPRRPKVSKSRTFRGEAVRSGLAPKARKPLSLYLMENSLVRPGAAKSQYQVELKGLEKTCTKSTGTVQWTQHGRVWGSKASSHVCSGEEKQWQGGRCPMPLCLAMTNPTNFGWVLTRWRSQDTMASALLLAKAPMEKYSLPVVGVDACMLWKSFVAEMPLQRLSMKSCYTNPCRSWKIAIGNGSRNCWLRIARGSHFHGCHCLLVAWPWHGACSQVSGLRGTLCLQPFGSLSLNWWSCTSMQGSCTLIWSHRMCSGAAS